jgi:hypothetical protein
MPTGKQLPQGWINQSRPVPLGVGLETLIELRFAVLPALDDARQILLQADLQRAFAVYLGFAALPRSDTGHWQDPLTATEVVEAATRIKKAAKSYARARRRLSRARGSAVEWDRLARVRASLLEEIARAKKRLHVMVHVTRCLNVDRRGRKREGTANLYQLDTFLFDERIVQDLHLPEPIENALQALTSTDFDDFWRGLANPVRRLFYERHRATAPDPHLASLISSLLPIWVEVTGRSCNFTNKRSSEGPTHCFASWVNAMLVICRDEPDAHPGTSVRPQSLRQIDFLIQKARKIQNLNQELSVLPLKC